MTIGERIKMLRENHKYTLAEVGAAIGASVQSLYKYENGIVTNIPSDKIEGLARIFSVSPAYLMGWEDESASIEKSNDFINIAAHVDGEPLTEEEQEEVINFIKFIKSKRKDGSTK